MIIAHEYFFEKQSPAFNGGAKIQSIKGNALAFNQLLQNGNFASTANWAAYQCALTVSDNVGTVTSSNATNGNIYPTSQSPCVTDHKYLARGSLKAGTGDARLRFHIGGVYASYTNTSADWYDFSQIVTATAGYNYAIAEMFAYGVGGTAFYKNVSIIDLTLMFGAGNEPTADEFTSLFPLDYYDYDAGTLLAFSGTGIRTAGDGHDTTTALPIADYFPSGMKSAGSVYDELTPKKAYTRVGTRAYEAGDENDPTVITDKTNTYYPLVTPTEADVDLDITYPIYRNGIEQVLPVNTSAPSTAPLKVDVNYYAETESNVPYRTFWLKNADGEQWDLTDKEFRCFLNSPNGLGFKKTVNITRYGEKAVKDSEVYDFPHPQGELLFYDSANQTRYDKYNQFMRFLNRQPITLFYQIPVSALSGIPDIYSLDCEVTEVQKTESSTDKILHSSIVFDGLSFWKGDEVIIEGTGNTYTIENDSDFPTGFEITVEGTLENPYFTVEQDGEVYGEAKFLDITAFDSFYVDSKDGEQNVVLEQSGSVLPNPLSYQDLSISNGSIYVTFVKLAKGESTLTIGMDSGSITKAEIRFTPMYRSV